MLIPLIEPTSPRYIHVNPATNRVHLLVPFVGGQDISTDNTCRSTAEVDAFFGGGGFSELESYKNVLEFHISLLEEGDTGHSIKQERLRQINIYLDAVRNMREGYQDTVNDFLAKPSNLYSIQLRPCEQDNYGNVVNPVFTIKRGNDFSGTPSSPLYNQMHKVFPGLTLGKPDPRTELVTATLSALSQDASFEDIQRVLTEQCQRLFDTPVDFQRYIEPWSNGQREEEKEASKANIDRMRELIGEEETREGYVNTLLGFCAPNLSASFTGSPFYHGAYTTPAEQAERLSIMTQFYLAVLNIHCRAQNISNENFGQILDNNAALSQALVDTVSNALTNGDDVEHAIIMFINSHKKVFKLSRDLSAADKDAIQAKFEITYRTVTATKENPHMDDFMILDTEARDEHAVFFTQKGLICTDFANIATTGPNRAYFAEIREEAATHPDVMRPQDEAVMTVEIEPEALVDKLDTIEWDKLPKEVVDACRALPAFQLRQFPDDVAKGNQDEAEAILKASDNKQTLLKTPARFTDYSGRTFNCTAYEYAYWAKDTHMSRMLERHMDDATKTLMLDKVNEMERSGLAYQQHGVDYQNPHYDVSFVLKDLSPEEFRQLQAMVGQNLPKIQQVSAASYQTLPFTATEYEQLKKALDHHKQYRMTSFFYTSPANAISNKLTFDFKSLITALDTYVTHYDSWDSHQRAQAWLDVGKAQREVPVHIANEYCRPDRSFDPCPEFNEPRLPRSRSFYNLITDSHDAWFPLPSVASGLGFDFALASERARRPRVFLAVAAADLLRLDVPPARVDLAAVSRLDKVRTADLTEARETLNVETPNYGLRA